MESLGAKVTNEPKLHYPTFSMSNVMKGIKVSSSDGSEYSDKVMGILQSLKELYEGPYKPSRYITQA